MASFLLLHPPLLTPAVWAPCAAEMTAAGHRVAVPDLRPAVDPPTRWYDKAVDLAAAALTDAPPAAPTHNLPTGGAPAGGGLAGGRPAALAGWATEAGAPGADMVVAHSGAGVLMPLVVDRVGAGAAVFVDAILPGPTSDRFRDFLASLPVEDGRLPRWSDWWPSEVMAEAVPDPDLRARLLADLPRLPVAFYDEQVPVPASWPPPRVGYLRLSPAYGAEAAEARRQGWRTRERDGGHLDNAVHPADVAAEVLALGT
jgi:hypothetical protein